MNDAVRKAVALWLNAHEDGYGYMSRTARELKVAPPTIATWMAGSVDINPRYWSAIEDFVRVPQGALTAISEGASVDQYQVGSRPQHKPTPPSEISSLRDEVKELGKTVEVLLDWAFGMPGADSLRDAIQSARSEAPTSRSSP